MENFAEVSKLWEGTTIYTNIHPTRKKMVEVFKEVFVTYCKTSTAELIAYEMEVAINHAYSFENNTKEYTARCRTLFHNLKHNEV